MDCILIRYGEIALKSNYVRKRSEDILIGNIKSALKAWGFDFKIKRLFGRVIVEGFDKKCVNILKHVFGIVSFSPCIKTESRLEVLKKESIKLAKRSIKKSDSFAVRCKRTGEHRFTSRDVEIAVGSEIVKRIGSKVDLTKPDKTIGIDIRDEETYIYSDNIRGPGGVPVGAGGKVVSIIQNFNGVAASWFFMKRGCVIVPVFIHKSKKFLDLIENWHTGHKVRPHYLNKYSTKKIEEILKENRIMEIVTGEDIKDKWIKSKHLVFRPLVGFNKKDLDEIKKVIIG